MFQPRLVRARCAPGRNCRSEDNARSLENESPPARRKSAGRRCGSARVSTRPRYLGNRELRRGAIGNSQRFDTAGKSSGLAPREPLGQRRIPKTPAIGKQTPSPPPRLSKSRGGPLRARLVTSLSSTIDIALALSHNSALMTRPSARLRRIDEFDPEYAR